MEISIKGDPKEIAALVLAVQERQQEEQEPILHVSGKELANRLAAKQGAQPPLNI